MKKCPYCAEEIEQEAVKCIYCVEISINAPEKEIEYFKKNPRDVFVYAWMLISGYDKKTGDISNAVALELDAITNKELVDTIYNYYLFLAIQDYIQKKDFSIINFIAENNIDTYKLDYLKENYFKIGVVRKGLPDINLAPDEERELLYQGILIYMSRGDFTFDQVLNMRGFWGIRRNLNKANKAMLIKDARNVIEKKGYSDYFEKQEKEANNFWNI